MTTILDLKPRRFWYYFSEICKIPHGSRNEAGLRDYIIRLAGGWDLEYRTDGIGNLVVRKHANASASKEVLILQSHLDMVCEAGAGFDIDFTKDPIKPKIDGGWIMAEGTTLGADNGVGVAATLAVLESNDIPHPPLEALFTVTEEISLIGAMNLSPDLLTGKRLINMDSEDDGKVYIGCAGGENSLVWIPYTREKLPAGYRGLGINISGLRGGHSGLVIHLHRGNAVKIAGNILGSIKKEYDILLSSMNSGTKHNVIPGAATVSIAVKEGDVDGIKKLIDALGGQIKTGLAKTDPDCNISAKAAGVGDVIGKSATDKIIDFLGSAPNGVISMSRDIKGLVETSTNYAIARSEEDQFYSEFLTRSSVDSELGKVKEKISALADLAGARIEEPPGYPGWEPRVSSPILKVTREVYKRLFGEEMETAAVHAGLECGAIGKKYPGMDMVSYGPQLEHVHSVAERVNIKTVEKFWMLTSEILKTLAK